MNVWQLILDQHDQDVGLPASQLEWMEDLKLMHHYTDYVSHTYLGATKGIEELWSRVIPREAMRHDFLLHGLLAMSAQSMAYLQPECNAKYQRVYARHQHAALHGFRARLAGDITLEVSCALFICAALISVTAKARSCLAASTMEGPKKIQL